MQRPTDEVLKNIGYLIRLIMATRCKGNRHLKGPRLPLCLSGTRLGEMTFDNTKNNLRTSCLHLLECHTACYWAFPPRLLAVDASSQICIGLPFEVVDTEND